jgi:hypothetical protein
MITSLLAVTDLSGQSRKQCGHSKAGAANLKI